MQKREAEQRILKLRAEINRYRRAYHIEDKSLISDEALDSLKKELFDLELQFPDLITPDSPTQRVGGEPLKQFKKVRHEAPMNSFNDAFSREDMSAWFTRAENYLKNSIHVRPLFYGELKIDGLAIELMYENGIFVAGATRGDGVTGEDITNNLKTIDAIPLRIESHSVKHPIPKHLVVRGEVFLTKKEFARINREQDKKGEKLYANPRNVAAGSVRQLDPKITASRKLDSFQYAIVTDVGQRTHEEEHILLKEWGFKTNSHNKTLEDLEDVFTFRDYWEKHREGLAYEVDGVVVIVNENTVFNDLGVVGKAPRGAIAYKFSPREATTRVKAIHVQVGRTGVLTPVAEFEPVAVGGITITHATLHNEDEIERLGLKIGDTVLVSRAGDVIPKVTKVFPALRTGKEKKFHMPTVCPVDGSSVIKEGALYRCSNPRCGARHKESLYHFVSRNAFDIRGLGMKIIDRFLDEGLIIDAADIFSLQKGDIAVLERFGEKSAENIIREVEGHKKVTLPRFLYSLGILHVGEETARALSRAFPAKTIRECIEVYSALRKEELESVRDIGPKVGESIYAWFHEKRNVELLKKFENVGVAILREKEFRAKQTLLGKTFVFTGELSSMSRDDAKEKARAMGADISESVSQKTSYVVVGENPGSKYGKAQSLGVKTLSEKEFLDLLK